MDGLWDAILRNLGLSGNDDPFEDDDKPPDGLLRPEVEDPADFEYEWKTGRVTRAADDFCLLDGHRFWSWSEGQGGLDGGRGLREGDEVRYKVRRRRDSPDAEWMVLEVCIGRDDDITDWVEQEALASLSWLTPEKLGRGQLEGREITAEVLSIYSDKINLRPVAELDASGLRELECDRGEIDLPYIPWKGDLLRVVVKNCGWSKDISAVKLQVLQAQPLRKLESSRGTVASWNAREETGLLNEEVFFSLDVCAQVAGHPQPGDPVRFAAVECTPTPYNGHNCWRAVYVAASASRASVASRQNELAALLHTQESEALGQFLAGHGGVSVAEKRIFLDCLSIGEVGYADIEICNNNQHPLAFIGLRKGAGSNSASLGESNQVVLSDDEPNVILEPNGKAMVRLKCVAGTLGRNQELVSLLFDREDASAGVVIYFDVKDPTEALINKGVGGYPPRRSVNSGYYHSQLAQDESDVLPGRRRKMGPAAFVQFRLKDYPVPRDLRDSVRENGSGDRGAEVLMGQWRCLQEPLVARNYFSKLSTMLHLEELELEESLKRYYIHETSFVKRGFYLALEVPGLAEKRPSLVIGDSVIARRDAVYAFEGFIHEVHANVVLLQFDENFHHTYCGEVFSVSFRFNRGPFRRLHRVAELAVQHLGVDFLFPSVAVPKEPQVNVHDDKAKGNSKERRRHDSQQLKVHPLSLAKYGEDNWTVPVLPTKLGRISHLSQSKLERRHGIFELFDLKEEIKSLELPYVNRNLEMLSQGQGQKIMTWFNKSLNVEQKRAVIRILKGEARPLPYIIYGPPGTGKTVTVVECILQLFYNLPSSRVLVCTPSNSSADLITERLAAAKNCSQLHRQLARLNAFNRKSEAVPESVRPFAFQAGAGEEDSPGWSGQGGATWSDLPSLRDVARRRVVVATCATSGVLHKLVANLEKGAAGFTHCLVDEAGHLGEAETLLPIMLLGALSKARARQVVLAGDPMQLGPVMQSHLVKSCGGEESLLERLSRRRPYLRDTAKFADHGGYDPILVTKLVRNYRSHGAIIKIPSKLFYHAELKERAPRSVRHRFVGRLPFLPNRDCPVLFHGIRGSNYQEDDSPSWFNPVEAVQLARYLRELCNVEDERISVDDVGIITPYRKQVEKIKQVLSAFQLPKFKVGSVEEFQGQERPVILISTVRCSDFGGDGGITTSAAAGLGFVGSPKRTNVALTRAQSLLIVVGDPHALVVADHSWREFIRFAMKKGCAVGCETLHRGFF